MVPLGSAFLLLLLSPLAKADIDYIHQEPLATLRLFSVLQREMYTFSSGNLQARCSSPEGEGSKKDCVVSVEELCAKGEHMKEIRKRIERYSADARQRAIDRFAKEKQCNLFDAERAAFIGSDYESSELAWRSFISRGGCGDKSGTFYAMQEVVYEESVQLVKPLGEALRTIFARTRSELIRAVDASTLPEKELMRNALAGTRVVMPDELYQLKTGKDEEFKIDRLKLSCGLDGLHLQTMADQLNGNRIVFVCPGTLLAYLRGDLRGPDPFLTDGLSLVLMHELGHQIDSSEFPKAYEKFGRCSARAQGVAFDSKNFQTLSYPESVADAWSMYAAISPAKRITKERTSAQQALVEQLALYCQAESDGVHPDGSLRANSAIASNPQVWGSLCPRSAPPPDSCDVSKP